MGVSNFSYNLQAQEYVYGVNPIYDPVLEQVINACVANTGGVFASNGAVNTTAAAALVAWAQQTTINAGGQATDAAAVGNVAQDIISSYQSAWAAVGGVVNAGLSAAGLPSTSSIASSLQSAGQWVIIILVLLVVFEVSRTVREV